MKGYLRKRGRVWYSTVDLPRRPDEPRRQKCFNLGQGTKAEARKRERDLLRKFDDGTWERETEMTVGELLLTWLMDNEHRLAAKTWEAYDSKVRRHLIPALGSVPLKKLRPKHLVDAYAVLRTKGLSSQTNTHLHRILHTGLNYGVRTLRVIKENVAACVPAPVAERRQQDALSEDQVRLLIEAAKGTRLEVPVLVGALTGLRRSELLALKWSTSVDLDRGLLSITETVEHTRRFGVRLQPRTKTKGSRRVIPLAVALVEALRLHKSRQEEARGKVGGYTDNGLVFCNPDGALWPPDSFSKQFAGIATRVGLPRFRFHDARHAFASMTLKNGVSVKEVSTLLGHSSPLLTLSTYAHVMEGMGREAVNGLAESLLKSQRADPIREQM